MLENDINVKDFKMLNASDADRPLEQLFLINMLEKQQDQSCSCLRVSGVKNHSKRQLF